MEAAPKSRARPFKFINESNIATPNKTKPLGISVLLRLKSFFFFAVVLRSLVTLVFLNVGSPLDVLSVWNGATFTLLLIVGLVTPRLSTGIRTIGNSLAVFS